MVPGEGAAALVLETASHARARGRAPYAALACARSGALPAEPYGFPEPTAAAERLLGLTANGNGVPQVAGVIGGASGAAPRDAIDEALLEALRARQAEPATYVRLDRLVGEWGGRGALAVALASLAIERGSLPALDPGAPEATPAIAPGRILVPGAARGGVVVPVVVEKAAN
jgi:3-oxoacyl-(acyl-carrier-protein) synthase